MKSKLKRPHTSRPAQPALTVEERLHELRDDLLLIASVFESQSVAPEYMRADLLTAPACRAASNLAARRAQTVRQVLDLLSATSLNASSPSIEPRQPRSSAVRGVARTSRS